MLAEVKITKLHSAAFLTRSSEMLWIFYLFFFSEGMHDLGARLCMYAFMHLCLPSCSAIMSC